MPGCPTPRSANEIKIGLHSGLTVTPFPLPSQHGEKKKARSNELRPGRNQKERIRSLEEAAGQRLVSTKQHVPVTPATPENDPIWPSPPEEDFESSLGFPGLDFPDPPQTLSVEDKVG